MQAQVKIGRIAGISIGMHYSWFIIAFLIVLSLSEHFRIVMPQWSGTTIWSAAIVTGVLFFVTLLLHELAHSLLAKSKGLRVRAITLFALGGVSQIESEAPDAMSEFSIAIVGPLTSLAIGLVCAGMITPNEIKSVERELWPQTSIQSVMRPLSELRTVAPDAPAILALEIMSRDDVNQLPVVANGKLVGILSRSSLLGFLRNRAELFKH